MTPLMASLIRCSSRRTWQVRATGRRPVTLRAIMSSFVASDAKSGRPQTPATDPSDFVVAADSAIIFHTGEAVSVGARACFLTQLPRLVKGRLEEQGYTEVEVEIKDGLLCANGLANRSLVASLVGLPRVLEPLQKGEALPGGTTLPFIVGTSIELQDLSEGTKEVELAHAVREQLVRQGYAGIKVSVSGSSILVEAALPHAEKPHSSPKRARADLDELEADKRDAEADDALSSLTPKLPLKTGPTPPSSRPLTRGEGREVGVSFDAAAIAGPTRPPTQGGSRPRTAPDTSPDGSPAKAAARSTFKPPFEPSKPSEGWSVEKGIAYPRPQTPPRAPRAAAPMSPPSPTKPPSPPPLRPPVLSEGSSVDTAAFIALLDSGPTTHPFNLKLPKGMGMRAELEAAPIVAAPPAPAPSTPGRILSSTGGQSPFLERRVSGRKAFRDGEEGLLKTQLKESSEVRGGSSSSSSLTKARPSSGTFELTGVVLPSRPSSGGPASPPRMNTPETGALGQAARASESPPRTTEAVEAPRTNRLVADAARHQAIFERRRQAAQAPQERLYRRQIEHVAQKERRLAEAVAADRAHAIAHAAHGCLQGAIEGAEGLPEALINALTQQILPKGQRRKATPADREAHADRPASTGRPLRARDAFTDSPAQAPWDQLALPLQTPPPTAESADPYARLELPVPMSADGSSAAASYLSGGPMSAPGLRAAGLDGPLWVGLVPPVTPPPDYKQLGQSIYRKPSTAREKPHRPSSAGATSPSAVSSISPRVHSNSKSATEKPETALEVERKEAIAAAAAAREAAVLRAEAQRIAGREAREAIARERAAGRTPLSPLSESTIEADAEAAAAQAMAEAEAQRQAAESRAAEARTAQTAREAEAKRQADKAHDEERARAELALQQVAEAAEAARAGLLAYKAIEEEEAAAAAARVEAQAKAEAAKKGAIAQRAARELEMARLEEERRTLEEVPVEEARRLAVEEAARKEREQLAQQTLAQYRAGNLRVPDDSTEELPEELLNGLAAGPQVEAALGPGPPSGAEPLGSEPLAPPTRSSAVVELGAVEPTRSSAVVELGAVEVGSVELEAAAAHAAAVEARLAELERKAAAGELSDEERRELKASRAQPPGQRLEEQAPGTAPEPDTALEPRERVEAIDESGTIIFAIEGDLLASDVPREASSRPRSRGVGGDSSAGDSLGTHSLATNSRVGTADGSGDASSSALGATRPPTVVGTLGAEILDGEAKTLADGSAGSSRAPSWALSNPQWVEAEREAAVTRIQALERGRASRAGSVAGHAAEAAEAAETAAWSPQRGRGSRGDAEEPQDRHEPVEEEDEAEDEVEGQGAAQKRRPKRIPIEDADGEEEAKLASSMLGESGTSAMTPTTPATTPGGARRPWDDYTARSHGSSVRASKRRIKQGTTPPPTSSSLNLLGRRSPRDSDDDELLDLSDLGTVQRVDHEYEQLVRRRVNEALAREQDESEELRRAAVEAAAARAAAQDEEDEEAARRPPGGPGGFFAASIPTFEPEPFERVVLEQPDSPLKRSKPMPRSFAIGLLEDGVIDTRVLDDGGDDEEPDERSFQEVADLTRARRLSKEGTAQVRVDSAVRDLHTDFGM